MSKIKVDVRTTRKGDYKVTIKSLFRRVSYIFPCTVSSQRITKRINEIIRERYGHINYFVEIDTGIDVPSEG